LGVILEMIPYEVDIPLKYTWLRGLRTVVGVTNRYYIPELREFRYAVFQEADCCMDELTAVRLGKLASVESFGEDLLALVVKTMKGYHYYLDLYTEDFMESILLASKFRNHLPASCRDLRHEKYALKVLLTYGIERYVLRVSPSKHPRDTFRVVYRKACRDPHHNEFISEVSNLYKNIFPF